MQLSGGFKSWWLYKHRYPLSVIIIFLLALLIMSNELSSLLPGLSQAESTQGLEATSVDSILENPINAPIKLLQWVNISIFGTTAFALRLPSLLLGVGVVVITYLLIHKWYQRWIAVIGASLLATSSWFLHTTRLGTSQILLVLFTILWIWGLSYTHTSQKKRIWILAALMILGLYVPMAIYLFIATAIASRKELVGFLKATVNPLKLSIGLFGLLIVSSPLWLAAIDDYRILKPLVGVGENLSGFGDYFSNLWNNLQSVFWRSNPDPAQNLGDLPLLDLFSATMVGLGIYHYQRHLDRPRSRQMLTMFVVLLLASGLDSSGFSKVTLLPITYMLVIDGVATLYNQWRSIFPKNPIASAVGLIPITGLFLITMNYHTNRYFVAFASAPETRAVYSNNVLELKNDYALQNQPADILVITRPGQSERVEFLLSESSSKVDVTDFLSSSQFRLTDYALVYIQDERNLSKDQMDVLGPVDGYVISQRSEPIEFRRFKL